VVKTRENSGNYVLSLYESEHREAAAIGEPYQGTYARSQLFGGTVSADLLVDIGLNSTANVRFQTRSRVFFHLWELVWTKEDVANERYAEESAIVRATWGVGARIAIACWDVRGSVDVSSPTGMAASATLNHATTLFDVQLLGADADALEFLMPLLSRSGSRFSMDEMQLLSAAKAGLIDYFEAPEIQRRLVPSLLAVDVDFDRLGVRSGDDDWEHLLASETFALERGAAGKSADAAVDHLAYRGPSHFPRAPATEELVRKTYRDFFHVEGDVAPPKRERDDAYALTRAGQ
jgi:hypothetical protein